MRLADDAPILHAEVGETDRICAGPMPQPCHVTTIGEIMDADILRESTAQFGEPPTIGHALPVMHEDYDNGKCTNWHSIRRHSIGASEAAAVLGLSRYTTPRKLYLEKQFGSDFTGNYHTRRGNALEPVALEVYREEIGPCERVPWVLRHPEHEWMTCNLDGWTGTEPVECKAPGDHVISDMLAIQNGEQVSPVSTVGGYLIQCQHQMAVTDAPGAWLVVLPGTREPLIAYIPADAEYQAWMIGELKYFWEGYVMAGVEPEPRVNDIDALAREWNAEHGILETEDGRLAKLFGELAAHEQDLADIIAKQADVIQSCKDLIAEDKLRIIVRARIYGAKKLTINHGERKHHVTRFQKSATIDTKRLRKDHPEIAAEYLNDPPKPQVTVTVGKEKK